MSKFTIDFLRISFSCFTRFFKHPSIANSYRICFKFERDMHKTQLLGMMRAFCCSYFSISATGVRIHNLETKIAIFLFFPHNFFKNHLCVKPSHHPMQYHVVNVVCKLHIIMMHASEDMLFEKMHIFLQLAAILSNNLHNLCKKSCLLNK